MNPFSNYNYYKYRVFSIFDVNSKLLHIERKEKQKNST